ncbi:MAG TPA: transcriptional repressor [Actinomycetota bacterium]|nr:transcriptional repressor [Actinomycetota bacterium]
MNDRFESCLREHGYRLTGQRRDVYQAVERLRHATPEQIAEAVSGVDTSTVYRALDVLVEVGLVTHTHIGHGPPTYHAVDPVPHLHLVCQSCGGLTSADIDLAAGFLATLLDTHGFAADLDYMALPGLCAQCRHVPRD